MTRSHRHSLAGFNVSHGEAARAEQPVDPGRDGARQRRFDRGLSRPAAGAEGIGHRQGDEGRLGVGGLELTVERYIGGLAGVQILGHRSFEGGIQRRL